MTSVLIAAGDPILQVGLRQIVECEDDLSHAGGVPTCDEVPDAAGRLRPDVILLDAGFRRRDPGLIARLAGEFPGTRVLVLVDHAAEECPLRHFLDGEATPLLSEEALELLDECCLTALRDSAAGCLPKGASPAQVVAAIRTVASGQIAASPWLRTVLPGDGARGGEPDADDRPDPITARELEVISLVARGLTNKGVARRLGIQEQTVKNHLRSIMEKLGVGSRLEVGLLATKHHLRARTVRRSESGPGG